MAQPGQESVSKRARACPTPLGGMDVMEVEWWWRPAFPWSIDFLLFAICSSSSLSLSLSLLSFFLLIAFFVVVDNFLL